MKAMWVGGGGVGG